MEKVKVGSLALSHPGTNQTISLLGCGITLPISHMDPLSSTRMISVFSVGQISSTKQERLGSGDLFLQVKIKP